MIATLESRRRLRAALRGSLRRMRPTLSLFTLLVLFPALALAQSPFDTGFTAMQTLFTGTIAKVASLIAIVIGGYQFAHGEPGAKKTLAGVAAGTGIGRVAPVPVTFPNHNEGAPGASHLGTGEGQTTRWVPQAPRPPRRRHLG
jgi:type IV secretion system protein VirB2